MLAHLVGDPGESRQPVERHYADAAEQEEPLRREFSSRRGDDHDKATDNEEQIDTGSTEVRCAQSLCDARNDEHGMPPHHAQCGECTQILNWTNHAVSVGCEL